MINIDVQNNINVDQKLRHDIPRHEVNQVYLLFPCSLFIEFFIVVVAPVDEVCALV